MICVECSNVNIGSLYYKYKSEYIKLTICPECGKVADKYIEYDNVILFIDILLLKPQAYRHIAYNITEYELEKDITTLRNYKGPETSSYFWDIINSYKRHKRILKFIVMIILFDVYLTWAYEERELNHTIVVDYILTERIYIQYVFFLFRSITEHIISILTIQYLFRSWLNWGSIPNNVFSDSFQNGYYNSVLLISILISSSIKLFPIIMLIWPYDKISLSLSIINIAAFFNTLESLKVVTGKRYFSISMILLISILAKIILTNIVLGAFVHSLTNISFRQVVFSEIQQIKYSFDAYNYIIANILNVYK